MRIETQSGMAKDIYSKLIDAYDITTVTINYYCYMIMNFRKK